MNNLNNKYARNRILIFGNNRVENTQIFITDVNKHFGSVEEPLTTELRNYGSKHKPTPPLGLSSSYTFVYTCPVSQS